MDATFEMRRHSRMNSVYEHCWQYHCILCCSSIDIIFFLYLMSLGVPPPPALSNVPKLKKKYLEAAVASSFQSLLERKFATPVIHVSGPFIFQLQQASSLVPLCDVNNSATYLSTVSPPTSPSRKHYNNDNVRHLE
jgi:hypothetical protein